MIVIVFENIHFVMKAEKIMKQNGLVFEIIPTPRELSSDCGSSIRLDSCFLEKTKQILAENDLKCTIY